jgi:transcriptional regulator with XRE-family HTH domain
VRSTTYEQALRTLANNVRAARLDLDVSQEEAAHRAGIAVRQWQRVESGAGVTLKTIVAVAAALESEIGDLLRR